MLLHRLLCFPLLLGFTAVAAEKNQAADTKFSRDRGFYDQPIQVAISSQDQGARIFYTTNGEDPSTNSGQLYSAPLTVDRTTVLRARAFSGSRPPSDIDTQSYFFLRDVVEQTGRGFPATWGTNLNQPVVADYEMDPEIAKQPEYKPELIPALKSIPTVSLVLRSEDLWGPARGIYSNPRQSGAEWERPASFEIIYPNQTGSEQINAGVRIQGGWNRRPEESPKHAFRLVFKKKYGPGKFKHPLFGTNGVREFDSLILRSGCNNTWLHWSGAERRRGDFVRDQWMRETLAEMGHASARGIFVHLYLNGLYWGLYNLTERPDESFAAAHGGGKPEEYDARNGENLLSGDDLAWKKLFALANGDKKGAETWKEIEGLVDPVQLADFLILNFYGGNQDWDRVSNWYAARRRTPSGPFRFFVWDGERTLEQAEANSLSFDDDQSPPRLFHRLKAYPEFQKTFRERAQKHLQGQGVLTPEKSAARFRRLANGIESAVVAESARWGDYRRDAHRYKEGPYELYTRNDHWRPERDRLLRDFFPKRTEAVQRQFKEAGLGN